jgi:hypothetical protein
VPADEPRQRQPVRRNQLWQGIWPFATRKHVGVVEEIDRSRCSEKPRKILHPQMRAWRACARREQEGESISGHGDKLGPSATETTARRDGSQTRAGLWPNVLLLFQSMQDTLTTFPYVVVRLDCTLCTRTGRYRLARLADRYGANCSLKELLEHLAGDCAYRKRQRHPIRPGCGARFKDLASREPPPPDIPPSSRLRLVAKGDVA